MRFASTKSIQSQLILYFTIAILVPFIVTSIVGVKLIEHQVVTRAETKTISDLNSAHEIYRNKISQIESVTRLTASRSLIIEAVLQKNAAFLRKDLPQVLRREKLDILTVVDNAGTVIARGRNPDSFGDNLIGDKFIQRVIATKRIIHGTDIVDREYLLKESTELAEQARMEIIPTPKAKPREGREETSGMMLKAAVPIFDGGNNVIGVLVGGILLNRNFEIVDKIKEIVYEGDVYKGQEVGTATIFQNDLRISTNVRDKDGSRAIATLISEEVNEAVLVQGRRYVGEAFVVTTWYITAYEPIRDIDENTIGVLYVGVLRQPFDDVFRNTIFTFLGIALAGVALVVGVAIYQAKRISTPLKRIEEIANRIADGDYTQEIRVKAPREIEHLAVSLDQMAKQLERERSELEEWGTKLEQKVLERTEEIKKIHAQLFRSEKLASLGKLAAGVAHEINNPLTGVLTNSSLLLDDLDKNDPRRDDVEVIVKETIRCREIVKRLLDFARQTKPQKKLTTINSLIDNIVLLVRNQASFRNIEISRNLGGNIPDIMADTDQIQQVFINIIINAAEAMTRGGRLMIDSMLANGGRDIMVMFKDTGPGIPETVRQRIFDPFFTTKEHGTGLGLAISYGIIEQHGGTINFDTVPGQGSTFTIHLPVDSSESE